MNKLRAGEDYIKLRKLLAAGYTPSAINVKFGGENEKATITLNPKEGEPIAFESKDDDVIMFSFSLKFLFDQQGNSLIGEVKDLNKFYDEAKMLFDPNNEKFHIARNQILQGKVKINYFPHLLLRQFLEDTSKTNHKPYLQLKDDYFIIRVLHVEEMKMVYEGLMKIRNQKSLKTKIFDLTLDLFRQAFHKDKNFLLNYQLFQKYNKADIMDILLSTHKEREFTTDQFEMLHKRGGIPADPGLRYIIGSYANMAETIIKLLNIIRAAIEITEGKPNPDVKKSSTENWMKIKNSSIYSIIVEEFDPRIRHGKAHNNFEIVTDKNIINFYEDGRIRKLAVSYSFEQLRVMWQRIHIILAALVMAVCVEQSALTGVLLDSPEYKMSLLRLGNFRSL